MIEVNHVQCRNLQDVDLRIRNGGPAGAICLLVGAPGTGKTTFLELLSGSILPEKGQIIVSGYDTIPESIAVRQLIGYAGEDGQLPPCDRVWEYLSFLAHIHGLRAEVAVDRVTQLSDLLGLTDVADRPIGQLSAEIRCRVRLAGALVGDPEYLLLDEVAEGLPIRARAAVYRLIRDLARDRTVIMAARTAEAVPYILSGNTAADEELPACTLLRVQDGNIREDTDRQPVGAASGGILHLTIKGDGAGAAELLSHIPGVLRVEDRGGPAGVAQLTVYVKAVASDVSHDGNDVRDEIFFAMAEKRYTVLSMTVSETEDGV